MATIQHQFGQATIDAVAQFCKADIKSVQALYNDEFSHIADNALRTALSRTHYGARWLYKVGLSLLVENDESIAHIRTQLIDYGSICEALLGDCILHGLNRNVLAGTAHTTVSCLLTGKAINWNAGNKAQKLQKRNFYWLIEVAGDENIVSSHLKGLLTTLRKQRNTVHVTELAAGNAQYYRALAKTAYTIVNQTNAATRAWKQAHP